jgi:uncharacterized protein (TIGR03435 family)
MHKANRKGIVLLSAAGLLAATLPGAFGLAQATAAMPDWQKAAGGKMEFEVASVRQNASGGRPRSNFSLDNGNAYFTIDKKDLMNPTGSLFSAEGWPLLRYVIFAYKLGGTQELALRFDYYSGLQLHTPGWIRDRDFDIEARAAGTATKDQMRLMMQSLLADRFKLAVHTETRVAPVFALAAETPGKLGPQLHQHSASDDCASTALPDDAGTAAPGTQSAAAIPIPCGQIAHLPPSAPGRVRFGGRNVTLAMLAESLATQTGLVVVPRPVIDKTGFAGRFDFSIEWTPEDTRETDNSETGGAFREALKEQLGLKLEPQKGPVEVLVIDHAEQPSPN